MSTAQTLLLGAIAGLTIFIGLPMGRMHGLSPQVKSFFTATATGILLFLFWDVLSEAIDPVESALHAHTWGRFAGGHGDRSCRLRRRPHEPCLLRHLDQGAAAAGDARARRRVGGEFAHKPGLSAAQWLSIFIATGIACTTSRKGSRLGSRRRRT
jgi:ZIP family zinc transporter